MTDLLDPQKQVNSICLSLLLQEIVPTSVRVSQKLGEPPQSESKDLQTRIDTPLSSLAHDLPGTVAVFNSDLLSADEVTLRIEAYGYSLGLRLTEVLMYKTPANNKIVDVLDIMKFLCRDVWKCLYGKQMDNLRTNHRGTFVLIDNDYRLISNLSGGKGTPDSINKARSYVWFPCGIIRGILLTFGIEAYTTAEISQFPAVTFNIQTAINN